MTALTDAPARPRRKTAALDPGRLGRRIAKVWDEEIVGELVEYVRIPNKSPHFDAHWEASGHMLKALRLMERWAKAQPVKGMKVEAFTPKGRTPLLLVEVAGASEDTVLLYGHMDKQPEFTGWSEGLGPWTPVIKNGRLYGRGGADDGYAIFSALSAIAALQAEGAPHARCVILIEASEESGSPDLPAYVEELAGRIGEPGLVVCLDAECGDYERFWVNTSLRGNIKADLRVDVLTEGVHSGSAGGVVPSSFRILRELLERVENAKTGALHPALEAPIPEDRITQAQATAAILGESVWRKFPWAGGTQPVHSDPAELLLNYTWRPSLSVTGAGGIPALADASNTQRPYSTLHLSFRTPPKLDAKKAAAKLKKAFETKPPFGAAVRFEVHGADSGWAAPKLAPWLEKAVMAASQSQFGAEAAYMGTGGSIPFMGMLGRAFPKAQFVVTGVLGPHSNAHGPNEFLELGTAKKLTACVAQILVAHAQRPRRAAGGPGGR